MEDREKHRPKTDEDVEAHKKGNTPVVLREGEAPTPEGEGTDDVEAHKKGHTPVALRGDEATTPEGEGTDDDVELHRAKNQSSKL